MRRARVYGLEGRGATWRLFNGEHPVRASAVHLRGVTRWRVMGNQTQGQRAYYRIRVRGELDLRWSDWFDGMAITHDPDGNSTLAGPLADQAALYGLLDKARDLGLVLVSVTAEPATQTQRRRVPYGQNDRSD